MMRRFIMPIRFVSDADFARVQYIATYCFPWLHQAQDKMTAYAQKHIKPEYVLGYYDDADILMAAIQMLPFRIMVGGVPLNMGGIAMVSSMPEGRHGGRIADLLKKSLEVMRERGQVVSMLGPFSFEFYRKYGWELGFDRMDYVIPVEHLKAFNHKTGKITAVTEEDIDALNDIYTAYAKKHNGCVIRDRTLWTDFVLDDPFADEYKKYSYLWHYDSGEPGGYIIYTIRDGKMNIYEMIYKGMKALEGLLWFIYAHEAQIEQAKWSTAVDERLHVLLPNPRVDMKLTPGMMFRVVDVNKALIERGYPDDIDEEFSIWITDTSAPWNEGPWHVHIAGGRAQIERTDTASLSCDIQAFSQMFLGYMPAERLAAIGRIEGEASAISAASKAFPPSATFNNNGF
jgi:predicted acetyltransferase